MRPLVCLLFAFCFVFNGFAEFPVPKDCEQAVSVTVPSWSSNTGSLQRWERANSEAAWLKIGEPATVCVGKNGLGWGLGLHGTPSSEGPRKKEGDLKAPAGVFSLTAAFGAGDRAVGKLPWQKVTSTLEAVDDPASRFYNQIVDRKQVEKPDWRSSEKMATIPVYALGVVVAHNPKNLAGAGSCIFIHLWKGEGSGTAGCTALREADMLALARWLDPAKKPVLIQGPAEVMEREWPRR